MMNEDVNAAASSPSPSDLKQELLRRRAVREASRVLSLSSSLSAAPTLVDQLAFSTSGSAAAWIERSKKIIAEEQKKNRQSAAAPPPPPPPSSSSSHLSGVRVAHDYEDFDEGSSRVLTLSDKPLLLEGEEAEDELVDIDLVVSERLKEKEDRKKGRGLSGHRYDALQEEGENGNVSLLAKYDKVDNGKDVEVKKTGIRLGPSGSFAAADYGAQKNKEEQDNREERKQRGLPAESNSLVYDVSSVPLHIDTEYKPVKFKKTSHTQHREKKNKTSSHSIDELQKGDSNGTSKTGSSDWVNELVASSSFSSDHASRSTRSTPSRQSLLQSEVDQHRAQQRTHNYLLAMQRGTEETERRINQDRLLELKTELDREEEELATAVTKARKVTQSSKQTEADSMNPQSQTQRNDPIKQLAERLKREQQQSEIKMKVEAAPDVSSDDGAVIFTSTSHFASGLHIEQTQPQTQREEAKKTEEQTEMAVDAQGPIKAEVEPSPGDDGASVAGGSSSSDESDDGSDVSDILGDEPLAGAGVAAALELAKRRRYLTTDADQDPDKSRPSTDFTRYDALGHPISAKEQFRELSHRFHGHTAGINKRDARVKSFNHQRIVMQKQREMDTRIPILHEAQKKLGVPYLVLDGKGVGVGSSTHIHTSVAVPQPVSAETAPSRSRSSSGNKRKRNRLPNRQERTSKDSE